MLCADYRERSHTLRFFQRFGTPVEDANRRDFTVNTLFYNVNKQVVEDFTGKGVNDLKQGLLRTPLEPRTTFLDDPLRVLRAVRFSSRYSFAIEAETSNGMQLAEVKVRAQRCCSDAFCDRTARRMRCSAK